MDAKTYDIKEVAKILNVSESSVRAMVKQDKLKKLPIDRPIRITHSSLEEFMGLPIQPSQASKTDDIVLKRKELLDLISAITDVQQHTNRLLTLLHSKLR